MQNIKADIKSVLIKIASPKLSSTGIVLPQYNFIITALQNIYGNKQVLIAGERFPRTLAKVLFIDPICNFACIEAPAGVIFPNIKFADNEKLKVDEEIWAADFRFNQAFSYKKGNILQIKKELDNTKRIIVKFKNANISSGSALFNEEMEFIGINQIIKDKSETINSGIPANYIINRIENYKKSTYKQAVRCPSCTNILDTNKLINNICPNCKTSIDKYLITEKTHIPLPTAQKIEEIIKKLNYEVAISRIGENYWEIEEGSALIRIGYDKHSGFIAANAILCKLPDKHNSNIYEYLLMENNYLKGLSFSVQDRNIILAMIQIHEKDLHINTALKLFKYLFSKADDYDDTLIEMGALPLHDE
jgi:serine protease Do